MVEREAKQGGPSLKSSSAPSKIFLSMPSVMVFRSSGSTKLDSIKGINCSNVNSVPSVFKALLSVLLK